MMQGQDAVVNLCSPDRAASAQPTARPKRRARQPAALIDLSTESNPVFAGPPPVWASSPAAHLPSTTSMEAKRAGPSRKRRWGDMEDEEESSPMALAEQQRQREQQQRMRNRMAAELERQRVAHQQQHHQRQRQQQHQQAQWQPAAERDMVEVTSPPAALAAGLQWGQTASRQQRAAGRAAAPAQTLQPPESLQHRRGALSMSARLSATRATGPAGAGAAAGVRPADLDDDALLALRIQEEEEDARLAAAMMAEEAERARQEDERMQARMAMMQRLEEQMAAREADFLAALAEDDDENPYAPYHNRRHGSSSRRPSAAARRSHRPAAAGAGSSSGAAAAAAAAAAGAPGHDHSHRRGLGLAMASALMAFPRWAGGRPGGSGGRGGLMLPQGLRDMREAMMGMQRAGIPANLLFSDRDFTADDYEMLCRLDDTVENRKGAAPEAIASLPTQVVPAGGLRGENGEPLSCAVCLEEWTEGARVCTLPCTHRFCSSCIQKWLEQKASCPICQRECKP